VRVRSDASAAVRSVQVAQGGEHVPWARAGWAQVMLERLASRWESAESRLAPPKWRGTSPGAPRWPAATPRPAFLAAHARKKRRRTQGSRAAGGMEPRG